MRSALLLLTAGVALGACGGRQKQALAEMQDFECKDRVASFIATNHMAADEIGVQMDCAEHGPRIQRWRVEKDGTRLEDSRSMTPGEFDDVWTRVADSGWENLKDCTNGGGDSEPIYSFDLKDNQSEAQFACQAQRLPFPYNAIVDPLEVAAAKDKGDLGDDEPQELKDLEERQKQKPQ